MGLKLNQLLVCFLMLLGSLLQAASSQVVAGYLDTHAIERSINGQKEFSLEMIDPDLLTDLYLAFWGFEIVQSEDSDPNKMKDKLSLAPLYLKNSEDFFTELVEFKKKNKQGCNILLAIGGWAFNDPNDPEKIGSHSYKLFSKMVASIELRQQFISSCMEILKKYSLDGVDLDWEYPGDLTRGGTDEDLKGYLSLFKEMKRAFYMENPKWILSVTLPGAVPSGMSKQYRDHPDLFYKWIALVSEEVHRITLMAYDYHGPFTDSKLTGVNAPLYRDYSPDSFLFVENSVESYLKNRVPKEKILLGMPLFGRGFQGVENLSSFDNTPLKPFQGPTPPTPYTQTPGLYGYYEIQNNINDKKFTFAPDIITDTARAYSVDKKIWVSFDNPQTIGLKAELVLKKKLLGAIFWSIEMDQYAIEPKFPNINSAKNVFLKEKQKIK